MANQIKQNNLANKLDALSETEYSEVLNYITRLETARPNKMNVVDDELIYALQNRTENCRARQVFEWESTRRENPNAALLRGAA